MTTNKPTEQPAVQLLTVGHSTHPIDEFIELLRDAGATRLVDIRTLPGSRHNPQFNEEELAPVMDEAGIPYVREKRLGGLRRVSHDVDKSTNGFWENASFHRYADYALGEEFNEGLEWLVSLLDRDARPAIMCSEAVWWRCHRRIVADYLIAREIRVGHLMPDGRVTPATLTRGGQVRDDKSIVYPATTI
ncbi:DUF488 family protein [Microbacterium sp. YY-01]|uniref:DUF488 domain-containing protein n=1 Tax=Microbacterium sp. YY-01 TaxID=3421634 RepID=UPI003D181F9B